MAQASDPVRSIAEVAQEHGLKPNAGSPFSSVKPTPESLFKCQHERPLMAQPVSEHIFEPLRFFIR